MQPIVVPIHIDLTVTTDANQQPNIGQLVPAVDRDGDEMYLNENDWYDYLRPGSSIPEGWRRLYVKGK